MYNYKNILYIVSAIAAAEKSMYYSQKFTTAQEFLEADEQVYFNATITLLIVIGEEVKKIDKQLLQSEPKIEWQNISDMRNVLAHDYRGVDEDIVFNVVKSELPKLKIVLIELLKLLPTIEVNEVLETKQYKHLKGII
jgi:uncharacterized protein with HEPN domain